jgi:MscS family membrane protein
LKRWAEAIAGELVQQRLAGEITWGDIIVLLCFLALTLFVHSVAAGFLRRKVRQADAATEEGTWRQSLWNTIGKPLYLLIWIYGAYFAAMPLLLKSGAAAESHAVRRFFDGAFHFGFFTAVLWAAFRFTRVLEDVLDHFARRSESRLDDLLVPLVGRTLRVVVPILGFIPGLPLGSG